MVSRRLLARSDLRIYLRMDAQEYDWQRRSLRSIEPLQNLYTNHYHWCLGVEARGDAEF